MSAAYSLVVVSKNYAVQTMFSVEQHRPFLQYFQSNRLTVFITATRLLSIWILAYHMYHYALREIQVSKENSRLLILTKDAQLANLSSQLNPHFLFNSLNTVKALILDNPASARRAIDLLSDLLRESIYKKADTLITIKKELSLVHDYLELEKMRFEDRLQVKNLIADEALSAMVPPLSIQGLVENAIKHGIDQSKKGGLIEIIVENEKGCVRIKILNPGKLDLSLNTGVGL